MQANGDGEDDSEEEGGRTRGQAAAAAAAAAEFEDDGNTDMCVLCGLGGSLLCCDGCPAAYHMRCIGETAKSIPPGEWLCPECSVGGRGFVPFPHKLEPYQLFKFGYAYALASPLSRKLIVASLHLCAVLPLVPFLGSLRASLEERKLYTVAKNVLIVKGLPEPLWCAVLWPLALAPLQASVSNITDSFKCASPNRHQGRNVTKSRVTCCLTLLL